MKQPYLIALIFFAPFLSILGQDETLHPWTDTQGRTLQASFISFDAAAQTVTIKWNGQVFPLPLNTLAPQSQELAKQLGAPPPAVPAVSSSPFDDIVDEVISAMPEDALGPEALDIDHDWTSSDGKTLSAKFISLVGDQLTIAMNGGAKEFTIPLNRFSSDSQALANLLQSLAKKHRPAPPKPAVSSKPVKVVPPKVVEADLGKTHTWTSADGRSLDANFASADENGVELKMRGRPMTLSWSKLDPQSVALGKALQQLAKSLIPTIIGGKDNVLERYGSGKWKDYNTVFESKAFEVGLNAFVNRQPTVHIWMLEEDGSRVQNNPITIRFEPRYDRGSMRTVKSLDDSPPVSKDRRVTTLKGTWNNGATFEYSFEFSDSGVSVWGKAKESSSEEFPTFNLPLWLTSPNVVPDSKNATEETIMKISGNGMLKFDPVEGKSDKFYLNEKWTDVQASLKKRETSNILKMAEFNGLPFGSHKIRVEPKNTRNSVMSWAKPYGGMFPIQGTHIHLRSMDGYEARQPGVTNRTDFKDRLEISRSGALVVKVYKGI
jgi:hypothetical protein